MNPQGTFQLPPPMSTLAPQVDWLFNFIFWTSVVSFVLIVGVTVLYVVKYRRKPGVKAQPTGHNNVLEVAWTVAPVFLLVFLFVEGWKGYTFGAIAPTNSIEVRVTAKQWAWDFTYMPSGAQESNTLWVPVHHPVRMTIGSSDVLHSFFVPAFRVKRDAVPGMYTSLWFEATHETPEDQPLTVFCAEYCGATHEISAAASTQRQTNHSTMLADLHVRSMEAFTEHVNGLDAPTGACQSAEDPMACWGEQLSQQMGCMGCHNTDGSQSVAPTWRGLWGSTRTFEDGSTTVADESYIANSIREPRSQVVQGFQNVIMPPADPTDNRVAALTAFIRSLATEGQ